jgi:hypothetical protein
VFASAKELVSISRDVRQLDFYAKYLIAVSPTSSSSEWKSGMHGQYKHASETSRALNIDSLLFNVSLFLLVRR